VTHAGVEAEIDTATDAPEHFTRFDHALFGDMEIDIAASKEDWGAS
jgi:hypothetical protein